MKLRLILVGWAAFVTMFILINGYMYLMGTLREVSALEYFTSMLWSVPVVMIVLLLAYYLDKHFQINKNPPIKES